MSKLLVAALAIAALGFLAYRAMYGANAPAADAPVSAPTDRLEAAHKAAKRIEAQQDQRADDADKAAGFEK